MSRASRPVVTILGRARHAGLAIALFGSAAQLPAQPATSADLILTNARVYTVDRVKPWAEAVAIKDGRILAVGSAAEVARRRGTATRVQNLEGRLLMPAFGDSHVHPIFGGMAFSRCPLQSGTSVEDYQRMIAACVAKKPGSDVIYGVGWQDALFPPNGNPRKEVLDQVSSDRPLIFESIGGHSYWLNSRALALAGITKTTPDPLNGKIDRDPLSGEPSGSLQESAMDLVKALIPKPSHADMEASILYVANHFNSLGITSWNDAGIEILPDGSSPTLAAYRAVNDQGKLTSHVTISLKWQNEASLEQLPALFRLADKAKTWGLRVNGVKFYADGVIPQRTAAMILPYEGSEDRGTLQIPSAVLKQAVSAVDARGMQAFVHAIGDGAVREGLDAFAEARKRNGVTDNRHMITHMNVVDPADQPRFGLLGATAQFQALWASEYPYMELTRQAIGPVRSRYIYPANSIAQSGGKLAYGADWPVGSANPLEGLEVAVTRRTAGDPSATPLIASEGVTLAQAVEAYTINVAFVNRLDRETGSISTGKSADLIVLDRNIFDIPVHEISKAKVLTTLFRGREVYAKLPQP